MYDDIAAIFISPTDAAILITAIAAVGTLLGMLLGWIFRMLLANENRIATLEQAQKEYKDDAKATSDAIKAIHERLDGFFLGSGPRSRPHGEER